MRTWRFFRDEAGQWRWQQVTVDRAVQAESRSSFSSYEDCLADAKNKGYAFAEAQERTRSGTMRSARPAALRPVEPKQTTPKRTPKATKGK